MLCITSEKLETHSTSDLKHLQVRGFAMAFNRRVQYQYHIFISHELVYLSSYILIYQYFDAIWMML